MANRERHLTERGAKPLEKKCSQRLVVPEKPGTALAMSEPENCYLVMGGLGRTRYDQLDHGIGAVFEFRFCNKSFGGVLECSANGD